MKIKEIETLTGMSRDNIRFYEKCGLLIPNRNDNGYREYNEDDVTTLKRIKLLRNLHLSIEDIRDIQTNKIDLVNHLDEHIKLLEVEKIDLDKSMETCRQMILDHVTYNGLDAQEYLQNFEMNKELKEDVIPRLKSPIRRYVARTIDLNIYSLFIQFIFIIILGVRSNSNLGMNILDTTLTLLLMLFIEPFLLSKFATTPGKALLGLKILNEDGNKLTYREALNRTYNVIVFGYGCFIPIFTLICNFVSYRKCNKNEELVWEEGNIQSANDIKPINIIGIVLYFIVITTIAVLLTMHSLLPPNRGELTIDEFSQNVNFTLNLNEEPPLVILDNNGNWIPVSNNDNYSVGPGILERYPQLHYVIENDELVEISFSIEDETSIFKRLYASNVRSYIIGSYLKAQESYSMFNNEARSISIMFNENNDFEYEAFGVKMIQKRIITNEEENLKESLTFIIRKKSE